MLLFTHSIYSFASEGPRHMSLVVCLWGWQAIVQKDKVWFCHAVIISCLSLRTWVFHPKFNRQTTREKRWWGEKQTRVLENSFSFFFSPMKLVLQRKEYLQIGLPANVAKRWVGRMLKSRKCELCLPVCLPKRVEIVGIWDCWSETQCLTCLWCSADLLRWPSPLTNVRLRSIKILPKNTKKN